MRSPTKRRFLILSPDSDQAQAIIRCLQQTRPVPDLSFGRIEGHRVVAEVKDDDGGFNAVVPTTALCTAHVLRRDGSVRLGRVTMDDAALKWFDKPWSLAFAEAHNVAIPRTWHNADDIPPDLGRIFYKPGIEGVSGRRAWVRRVADLPEAVRRRGSGFLFQEVVPGREVFSYGFLADRGRTLASVGLMERLSYPPLGGSAAVMEIYEDDKLAQRAEALISASSYSGWGLIEFKWCPTRRDYVFMEVNPKFWASMELTLRTRPQFAKLLFDVNVAAEPIQRMWWPRRFCMMGIDHWPRHVLTIAGAHRSRETLSAKTIVSLAVPYGLRASLRGLGLRARSR